MSTIEEQKQNVDAGAPCSSSQALAFLFQKEEDVAFPNETLNREVPCQTKEGDLIPVKLSLLLQSKLFSNMFKNLGLTMDESFTFPVLQISTEIFKRAVKWMEEHDGKPELKLEKDPETRTNKWVEMTEFEKQFFDVKNGAEFSALVMAAMFLEIPSMYLLACQSMAAIIREKPEQLKDLLGLKNDVTDKEKEAVRRKNVWVMY